MDKLNLNASVTNETSENVNSRREFFAKTGLFSLGMLAAVTLGKATPGWAATKSESTSDDIQILNAALGHEYQAIAAYQVGAESGLLQKPILDVAVKFHEICHLHLQYD